MTQIFARLAGNTVAEIIELDDDVDLANVFHSDLAATLQPCTADVRVGMVLTGGAFVPPPPQPPPSKADLAAYAADKRWRVETGGTVVSGIGAIATDRDSQSKLLAEMVAISAGVRADPSGWKLRGNGFVMLSNTDMMAAIMAARAHITTAFGIEASQLAGIAAGSVTTYAQIDEAFAGLLSD